MRSLRTLPLGAAVATLAVFQLGAAGYAHAADPSDYAFSIEWGGTDTHPVSVFAPGSDVGYGLTIVKGGSIPMAPATDGNVLLVVRPTGAAQPGLPTGVTVDFPYGNCAGTGEPGVFLCDSSKPSRSGGPGLYGQASVNVHIGANTPDRTRFDLDALIVPSADTTYAKVLADQAGGKRFPAQRTQHIEVESQERVAKDTVAFETEDLTGGGTVVQTVKVHAEDSPDFILWTESGDPKAPWQDSEGRPANAVDGLDLVGLTSDNGGSCQVRPVADQHNSVGERPMLAQCRLKPGDSTLKATFKVAAALKQTVKLNGDYLIYADKGDWPEFTRSATFAVRPAAASTAPSPTASASPTAGATPTSGTTGTTGTTSTTGTTGTSGTSTDQELATTGSSGAGWYAGAGAALVVLGAGTVALTRRKRRSVRA